MGNEAGDADSIISSLTLSFVNSITEMSTSTNKDSTCSSKIDTISLPLASIKRNDMALRRDVVLLLQMAGIDSDKLVYLDDAIFTSMAQNNDIHKEITLVDHNKLRSDLWSLEDCVVEILDHHQDEGGHESSVTADKREVAFQNQVALVGSTCTLVTERLIKADATRKVDAGLGLTLLGVILLDTMNMNQEAGKGTRRDQEAIDFLIRQTEWDALDIDEGTKSRIYGDEGGSNMIENRPPSRSHFYEYLSDSKFDRSFWLSMSPRDALRIDYKRFEPPTGASHAFGLASVLLDMEDLLSKDGFHDDAIAYMKEANVDLLGVLTMVIVDDKPQRELLLVGGSDRVGKMMEYLLNDDSAAFLDISKVDDVVAIDAGDEDTIIVKLKQGNPKGSRKQVAPVMLSF